jgi:hypothetical protein
MTLIAWVGLCTQPSGQGLKTAFLRHFWLLRERGGMKKPMLAAAAGRLSDEVSACGDKLDRGRMRPKRKQQRSRQSWSTRTRKADGGARGGTRK